MEPCVIHPEFVLDLVPTTAAVARIGGNIIPISIARVTAGGLLHVNIAAANAVANGLSSVVHILSNVYLFYDPRPLLDHRLLDSLANFDDSAFRRREICVRRSAIYGAPLHTDPLFAQVHVLLDGLLAEAAVNANSTALNRPFGDAQLFLDNGDALPGFAAHDAVALDLNRAVTVENVGSPIGKFAIGVDDHSAAAAAQLPRIIVVIIVVLRAE